MEQWYVVCTRTRAEKKTANWLEEDGYEVYCPLHEEVRQWSDRKKKVKVPVIRSYVFIKLSHYGGERQNVLKVPGVLRFLWWAGKPAIVREEEITQLRKFLNDYKNADIQVTFHTGERVEINGGPFREYKGTIVDMDRRKAILQIDSLGLVLKAQLSLNMLKKTRN